MRLIVSGVIFLFMVACAPQPNPVVQRLELTTLKLSTIISMDTAIKSALQRKNINETYEDKDFNSVTMVSTKYVEPFQGCARYNVAYRYKRSGFFGSEKNYDSIFKVCEKEQSQISVELLAPEVPDITGTSFIVNEKGKVVDEIKKI